MSWLRTSARKLSLLALFALAVQFGLSFGHVHLDRAFGGKTVVVSLLSQSSPQSGTDPDGRADQCAICATIALANTLIDATPPSLPLPVAIVVASVFADMPSAGVAAHPLGFRSRAPPLA